MRKDVKRISTDPFSDSGKPLDPEEFGLTPAPTLFTGGLMGVGVSNWITIFFLSALLAGFLGCKPLSESEMRSQATFNPADFEIGSDVKVF